VPGAELAAAVAAGTGEHRDFTTPSVHHGKDLFREIVIALRLSAIRFPLSGHSERVPTPPRLEDFVMVVAEHLDQRSPWRWVDRELARQEMRRRPS
jgi:hypothetical protein